jgi:hypothetical protein
LTDDTKTTFFRFNSNDNEFVPVTQTELNIHHARANAQIGSMSISFTEPEPELTPQEQFYQLEKDFVMLATMNTNHLNAREIALAKTNMEQAGMWFHRALEKHHKPSSNNSTGTI